MPQAAIKTTGPTPWTLVRELIRLGAFVGGIGVVVYAGWHFNQYRFQAPPGLVQMLPPSLPGAPQADCGALMVGGRLTVVEMLYSDEKQAWIEQAAELFSRRCPNIQVRLTAMDDFAAAHAIVTGTVRPTVWAPTDEIVVTSLVDRWAAVSTDPLFAADEPLSLVRSPLVLLLWDDRLRVLAAIRERTGAQTGPWSQLCAGIRKDPPAPKIEYTAPFPSLAEIAGWGHVKIGHSSPTRSAAGLEAIYLMAYDYLVAPAARGDDDDASDGFSEGAVRSSAASEATFRAALDAQQGELGRWMARCEGGLVSDPDSAALLTDTMFHVGGERYDGVATYEHLVFPILDRLDGNDDVMDNVTVVYPRTTIVNKHPAMLLADGDEAAREAARKWLAFLRSAEMQRRAIEFGFRPADPEVKIRDHHVDANPFLRHRRYGIAFSGPLREPPRLDGARVNLLIELWRDATGRN